MSIDQLQKDSVFTVFSYLDVPTLNTFAQSSKWCYQMVSQYQHPALQELAAFVSGKLDATKYNQVKRDLSALAVQPFKATNNLKKKINDQLVKVSDGDLDDLSYCMRGSLDKFLIDSSLLRKQIAVMRSGKELINGRYFASKLIDLELIDIRDVTGWYRMGNISFVVSRMNYLDCFGLYIKKLHAKSNDIFKKVPSKLMDLFMNHYKAYMDEQGALVDRSLDADAPDISHLLPKNT